MRHLIAIAATAAIAALVGCANVATVHSECERSSPSFPAAVACLESKIAQDGRLSGNADAKLYTLRARQLSQRVQAGQMSEIDARVELQRLVVEIDDKRKALVFADDDVPTTTRIRATANCVGGGGYATCTIR